MYLPIILSLFVSTPIIVKTDRVVLDAGQKTKAKDAVAQVFPAISLSDVVTFNCYKERVPDKNIEQNIFCSTIDQGIVTKADYVAAKKAARNIRPLGLDKNNVVFQEQHEPVKITSTNGVKLLAFVKTLFADVTLKSFHGLQIIRQGSDYYAMMSYRHDATDDEMIEMELNGKFVGF